MNNTVRDYYRYEKYCNYLAEISEHHVEIVAEIVDGKYFEYLADILVDK